MEGEKERLRQHRDEKESNEADDYGKCDDDKDKVEEDDEDLVGAALVWQERYGEDNLGLPIMHWEALSLRIAELEKQEEEKKEKRLKVRDVVLSCWKMVFVYTFTLTIAEVWAMMGYIEMPSIHGTPNWWIHVSVNVR